MYLIADIQNLVKNGPVVSEKSKFQFQMLMTSGQGQEITMTFNTHISSIVSDTGYEGRMPEGCYGS